MASQIGLTVVSVVVASLLPLALAETATANFIPYDHTNPTCDNAPPGIGIYGAGVGDPIWDDGKACGKVLVIKCKGALGNAFNPNPCIPGKTVAVRVVASCSDCSATIILTEQAYAIISRGDEIVDTEYYVIQGSALKNSSLISANAELGN